ncbi:MAG: hypothetical protein BAJALOKI1v1_450010 [Promethearchaeota archaeon]|nr:MAG: hypothetical protein BAJALOKI1v1_450010 [Candidatus Lokiarchaeota archaeon]
MFDSEKNRNLKKDFENYFLGKYNV